MIESVTTALNSLRNSTILFGDQNIGRTEKDGIKYDCVALTEEQLQAIEYGLNEQVAIQDQILSTFEINQNAVFLIRIADGLDSVVRGSRFDYLENHELTNNFLRESLFSRGGSFGHKSLLERDGAVTKKDRTAIYLKYSEFIRDIETKNNQLSVALQQISDLSFDDLLADLGYSSLEQLIEYIKKYSDVRGGKEFDDFVTKTQNGLGLKLSPAGENFKNLTYTLDPYIRLDVGSAGLLFLKLSKQDIDNISSFIGRHKIDIIQDNRTNDLWPSHMYRARHSISTVTGKLTEQFFGDLSTSYREGIFFHLRNYLMTNIIDPKARDLLAGYQNRERIYKLNSPEFKSKDPLTFDGVKDIVISSLSPNGSESRGWNAPSRKSEIKARYYAIAKGIKIRIDEISFLFKSNLITYLEGLGADVNSIDAWQVINLIDKQIGDSLSIDDTRKMVFKESNDFLVSDSIMPDIDGAFNRDYIGDLSFSVMKRVYTEAKNKNNLDNLLLRETKETKEEQAVYDNEIVDLKTVLSPEDIRLISFIVRSYSKEYSFKDKAEKIDIILSKAYEALEKEAHSISNNKNYFLRSLPIENIKLFFDALKKTLLGQLKQEESYLQGRSDSLGITAELMADGKKIFDSFFLCARKDVKHRLSMIDSGGFGANPIMNPEQYDYVGSHGLNPLNSAALQIAYMFDDAVNIVHYFRLFPEDAVTFFGLTDQNSIRSWLIRIINFIGVSDNTARIRTISEGIKDNIFYFDQESGQYIPVTLQAMYVMQRNPDEEPQRHLFNNQEEWYKAVARWESKDYQQKQIHFLTGPEFLTTALKDLSGSKKERLEKMDIVAGLLHDFGSVQHGDDDDDDESIESQPTSRIIINSKYFSKMYNKSLSDAVKAVLSIDQTDDGGKAINWTKVLNQILVANPDLIPQDYLNETMMQCVSMLNIKDSTDLDSLLDVLVRGNLSESVRKLKFIAEVLSQYSTLVKYIAYAKPKEKDVFAPNIETDKFRFRVLGDLDPYHFTVGIDTDCCQAIGNAGEGAAIDSFINPEAGVLILDSKTNDGSWKMVAQSYFHFANIELNDKGKEEQKAIILDNIETGNLGRGLDPEFYRKAYAVLGKYLRGLGFNVIGCGIAYTRAIGSNDFVTSKMDKDPRHFEVKNIDISPYTDFSSSRFFDLLQPKFSFDMPDVVPTTEVPIPVKSASLIAVAMNKSKAIKSVKLARLMSMMLDRNFRIEVGRIIKLAARINELPE